MTTALFSRLKYDREDAEFLSRNFGLNDLTPKDGELAWAEQSSAVQDFYQHHLSQSQQSEFSQFVLHHQLTAEAVSRHQVLGSIAQKYLRWKFISDHHIDPSVTSDRPATMPLLDEASPGFALENIVVDVTSIKSCEDLFEVLKSKEFDELNTPTFALLKKLILKHQDETQFSLSREAWQSFFFANGYTEGPNYTSNSTWDEILLMWQASDLEPHPIMNDSIAGTLLDGQVRFGRSDMRLTFMGLSRYIYARDKYILPNPTAFSGVGADVDFDEARLRGRVVLPDRALTLSVWQGLGTSINLKTEPHATVKIVQDVTEGDVQFFPGRPIIALSGFSVDVDATHWVTKGVAEVGQQVTSWVGKDFDAGLRNLVAISDVGHRLMLLCKGEPGDRNVIQAVNGEHYLMLDGTSYLKQRMDEIDPSGKLSEQVINADGDLYDDFPIARVQQILIEDITLPQSVSGIDPAKFEGTRFALEIDRVGADLTGIADQNLPGFVKKYLGVKTVACQISAGWFSIAGSYPGQIKVDGGMKIALGSESSMIQSSNGSADLIAQADIHIDTETNTAYAEVRIDEVWLSGVGSRIDGDYDGSIFVALDPASLSDYLTGTLSTEDLMSEWGADILVDLAHDNQQYLMAALKLRARQDGDFETVRALMADYQINLSDESGELYGLIDDGQLFFVESLDEDNIFLSGEIETEVQKIVSGGLFSFWSKDALLVIRIEEDGTLVIRPQYKTAVMSKPILARSDNLTGEMRLFPKTDKRQRVVGYHVQIRGMSLDIPNVKIGFKNSVDVQGRTRLLMAKGDWDVSAHTLADLFSPNHDWEGQGTLVFQNEHSRFRATDTINNSQTIVDAQDMQTDLSVQLMHFNPAGMTLGMSEKIERAKVGYEDASIKIESEVSGSISFTDMRYPVLSFRSDKDFIIPDAKRKAADEVRAAEQKAVEEKIDPIELIQSIFKPFLTLLQEAPNSGLKFPEADFQSDNTIAIAESLQSLKGQLRHLGLYADAEYTPTWYDKDGPKQTQFKLYSGFKGFILNPRLKEGAEISIPNLRDIIQDNKLCDGYIPVGGKVYELGERIKGVLFDPVKDPEANKRAVKVHIDTNFLGGINLITFISLLYPFKMCGFYDRVNQRLRDKAGLTQDGGVPTQLKAGEIPRDLGDIIVFADELFDSIGLTEKIQDGIDHKREKFKIEDFIRYRSSDIKKVDEALKIFPQTRAFFADNEVRALTTRLNSLIDNNKLVESFSPAMIEEHFSGETKRHVFDLVEAIQKLREERKQSSFLKETFSSNKEIHANNAELLRLYIKGRVTPPQLVSLDHLVHAEFSGTIKQHEMDLGNVKIGPDHDHEFSYSVNYNPHERDSVIDPLDPNPYLAVKVATGEGEELINADLDYLSRSLLVTGHSEILSGLELYMGGPLLDTRSPAQLKVGRWKVSHGFQLLHAAPGAELPSAALVDKDGELSLNESSIDVENLDISGSNGTFQVKGHAKEGSFLGNWIYFNFEDPETHMQRDALIDQVSTTFSDVELEELKIKVHTDEYGSVSYEFPKRKLHGNLSGDMTVHLLLSTDEQGHPEYVTLQKFKGENGKLDLDGQDVRYSGNITFVADIPAAFMQHPAVTALTRRGVKVNLTGIDVSGSLDFSLNGPTELLGPVGSLKRLPNDGEALDFNPMVIRLKGEITYQTKKGDWITLRDPEVPVNQADFELLQQVLSSGERVYKPVLSRLDLPASVIENADGTKSPGERITAMVSGQGKVPPNLGSGTIGVEDAALDVGFAKGFSLHSDTQHNPVISAPEVEGKIVDQKFKNSIEFSATDVEYENYAGSIHEWTADGDGLELVQGIIHLALEGRNAKFTVKGDG